jgi:polar amino acid transport system substrate-binding protein
MKRPLALATLFCALSLAFNTAARAETLKVASTPRPIPFRG